MLLTKQTTREADISDRLKLGRLKNAQREQALKNESAPDVAPDNSSAK